MLLLVLVTPICGVVARGGADLFLTEHAAVSWYEGRIVWPLLALLVSMSLVQSRRPGAIANAAWTATIGAFALATVIFWTGGGRLGAVSLRHPEASFMAGCACLALAVVIGRGVRGIVPRRPVVMGLALALAVGGGLGAALVERDALMMRRALDHEHEADARGGLAGARRPDGSPAPNVLWIVVDTLRADALGAYGASQPTPAFDALAERGVLFERAQVTAPWTLPSMMSLFSARLPSSLDPEGRGRAVDAANLPILPAAVPSWIRRLHEAGYRTVGFQKNPFLGEGSGFERDFDLYRSVGGDRAEGRSGEQLVRAVLRWADVWASRPRTLASRPVLLYVHFMDPHIDYAPPQSWWPEAARDYRGPVDGSAGSLHRLLDSGAPSESDRLQLERLYRAEVRYLDAQLGSLLSGLEARGLLGDETIIVFNADHGEQFGEHGSFEHGDLHRENVRVPLVIAGGGLVARRVDTLVSMLDLGPTVLDLVGLEGLERMDGRSMAPHLDLMGSDDAKPFEAPAPAPDGSDPVWTEYGDRLRLDLDPWVLLLDGQERVRVYDGRGDPLESKDLAPSRPELRNRLRDRALSHRDRDREVDRRDREALQLRDVDPKLREALRALGYVH